MTIMATRERNIMTIVLVPNKAVVQKAPEPPREKYETSTEISAGWCRLIDDG